MAEGTPPAEGTADPTTIRVSRDGPLSVRGPARLEGADGTPWTDIPSGTNVALCRCGRSQLKPFCDGSHNAAGFDSAPSPGTQPYPWG
jgi:CDGSH-type Zn-finger protein